MPAVAAVADDLSGAMEAAAGLAGPADCWGDLPARSTVFSSPLDGISSAAEIVVVDTDTRSMDQTNAVHVLRRAMSLLPRADIVFKKIDSQFRGNTAAELEDLARSHRLVVAPSLPAMGRTVLHGISRVGRSELSLPQLFSPLTASVIDLSIVREGAVAIAQAVRELLAVGRVPIIDAETDEDLDATARALLSVEDVVLVGSGGLASAVGRVRRRDHPLQPSHSIPATDARPVTAVVGSIEPVIAGQLAVVDKAGVKVVRVSVNFSSSGWQRTGSDDPAVVVALDPHSPLDRADPSTSSARLASLLAESIDNHDLVLTGGETARRVLEALGEGTLHPLREIHRGAILSISSSGRLIATRPGSFGNDESLLAMINAVTDHRANRVPNSSPSGKESSFL